MKPTDTAKLVGVLLFKLFKMKEEKTVDNLSLKDLMYYIEKFEKDKAEPAYKSFKDEEVGVYWEATEYFTEWLKEQ